VKLWLKLVMKSRMKLMLALDDVGAGAGVTGLRVESCVSDAVFSS
jgi:hypothetical protein